MAKSLEERVAALEAKVGNKSIADQLREQAELIERLLDYRFEQLEKVWNPRYVSLETRLEKMQKDMTIVREGMAILLKRL